MSLRRILFRADASKTTGYGHFIRSLALAGYLKNYFDCYFATFNSDTIYKFPTDNQLKQIQEVCTPIPLQGDSLQEFNDRFYEEIQPSDIVVLDNYYYTTDYQKKIKEKGCKLVCIDDVHNRNMVCDLLITVCPLEKKDFSVEKDTEFLGGIEYGFLREPFFHNLQKRNIQEEIKDVLIAMGGADAFNLTNKIVSLVHKVIPEAKLNIIAGETVNISEATKAVAKVHRNQNADQIVALMDAADIGIFPASTICIEAMARRLPIISGFYADNQKEFYNYGVSHNYFSPIGCLCDHSDDLSFRVENALTHERPTPVRIDFEYRKEILIKSFIELSKN